MDDNAVIEAMQARFRAGLKTRVLAFGSSNTEHFLPGMHWFDVFQTYYSPDPARNGDLGPFYAYMDALRRVAAETKAGLIDHLKRWELFRKAHPDRYLPLMHDGFHVNHRGNTVMGVDIGRHFGATVAPDPSGLWDEALAIQQRMDALEGSHR